MKTVLRTIGLVLMLGGWAVAAMCVHIVRTPDPGDPQASKFVVFPKAKLQVADTYVDARGWTTNDVASHAELFHRVLAANKADQFKYLTNPRKSEDPESQINDELKEADRHPSTKVSMNDAGRLFGFELSY